MGKNKKPLWKKWWVWLIAIIVVMGMGASGGESEKDTTYAEDKNTQEIRENENNEDATTEELVDKVATESKAEEKVTKIKAGTYKIGTDLPAGEYVIIAKGMAYIEIAADSTGQLESIIANDNISGHSYITVDDGEYLKIRSGEAYEVSEAPSLVPVDGVYKDGKYLVGKDIPAGEYKVSVKSGMAYIEVSSNSRGTLDSIITNDNLMEDSYITIQDGQYIKLSGAEISIN